MFDATATELNVLSIQCREPQHDNFYSERPNAAAIHRRTLIHAVIASLHNTMGPHLLPSVVPHLIRGIGQELARRFDMPAQDRRTGDDEEPSLSGLCELETKWGCRYEVVEQRPDRFELAIFDCPLEPQTGLPLHLCWLYAGILGETAGRRLGYAKTSVVPVTERHAATSAAHQACRLTLYLRNTADSAAADGTIYPHARQALAQPFARPKTGLPLDRLSDREWQVLRLIGEGFSDREIADALQMSLRTAENHASRVYTKLGVHGRARLIRYALRHRIVNL